MKMKRVNLDGSLYGYRFNCPGCNETHTITTRWTFNGDLDNPTVSPSIRIFHPANPNEPEEFKEYRKEHMCHSYIKNGKIEFLPDCTHHLVNQEVDLPEI